MSEQFDTLILSKYADLCVNWRMEVVSCRSNAKDINNKLLSLESVIESFGLGLPGLSPVDENPLASEQEEITNEQAISNAQAIEEAQIMTDQQEVIEADAKETEILEGIPEAFKPVPRPAVANSEPSELEALVARPAKADLANA